MNINMSTTRAARGFQEHEFRRMRLDGPTGVEEEESGRGGARTQVDDESAGSRRSLRSSRGTPEKVHIQHVKADGHYSEGREKEQFPTGEGFWVRSREVDEVQDPRSEMPDPFEHASLQIQQIGERAPVESMRGLLDPSEGDDRREDRERSGEDQEPRHHGNDRLMEPDHEQPEEAEREPEGRADPRDQAEEPDVLRPPTFVPRLEEQHRADRRTRGGGESLNDIEPKVRHEVVRHRDENDGDAFARNEPTRKYFL